MLVSNEQSSFFKFEAGTTDGLYVMQGTNMYFIYVGSEYILKIPSSSDTNPFLAHINTVIGSSVRYISELKKLKLIY